MKKIIALFLTLLMVLTSVSVSYAATATETINESQSGMLISDGRILTGANDGPSSETGSPRFGIINFDLTDYLPKIYLANTVKLQVKSNNFSGKTDYPFALEIVADSKEMYTDFTKTYSQATAGGVFEDGTEIYRAETIGYSGSTHKTNDIKDTLITALESGNNNIISIRLVSVDGRNVQLQKNSILAVEYDDALVSDESYYEKILESFDIEEKANIDSENVNADFVLPTFYKGSEISWSSDKAAISVSSDGIAKVNKSVDGDVTVTLTANLSYKEGSSYQKSFTLKVAQKTYIEVLGEKFNANYLLSDESYDNITKDINLDKTFEGATLSWESSNDAVVNSDSGRVIRSETQDVSVILTPTISYGGESKTLNPINLTVKKLTASTATAAFTTAGLITKDGRIITEKDSPSSGHDRFGFINFDLTNYLPQIYFANTISLNLKSGTYGDPKLNPIAIEIVADSKEKYSDFTKTYWEASSGGVTEGGTEIYRADQVGYAGAKHTVADIKDELIKALESGDNNIISLRIVDLNGTISLERSADFEIKYDASLATDQAYYEKVTESFDLEEKANVDLDNIKADFKLPSFFKGSKISWTSDKSNIAVSSDGTAKVTRGTLDDEAVTLTATFSYTDGSSYVKTFTAIVARKNIITIEAVKNNDGTFSAVIKSNEAVTEKYTLYFASYADDNTLIGVYGSFINALNEGTTRVDADAEEFLTNGATKIKCILLKGDTLTPACKNAEVPN